MRNEQWIFHDNSSVFSQIKNCLKGYNLHQIQENWAGTNFMTTLHVNSLLITYAGVQRWNWKLQLPMDTTILRGGGGTLDLPLLYTALDNGHLFITATFFCRQGGCCGVVHDQLH